jgi:hypothetical protein
MLGLYKEYDGLSHDGHVASSSNGKSAGDWLGFQIAMPNALSIVVNESES